MDLWQKRIDGWKGIRGILVEVVDEVLVLLELSHVEQDIYCAIDDHSIHCRTCR